MTTPPRELSSLVGVARADVYKNGRRAAQLARVDGSIRFAYDAQYLSQHGPAVATTLPLTDTPVLRAGRHTAVLCWPAP